MWDKQRLKKGKIFKQQTRSEFPKIIDFQNAKDVQDKIRDQKWNC